MPKGFVVLELFKKLRIICKQRGDDSLECLVVFDARVLPIGISFGVLISRISRHPRRYFTDNSFFHPI